MADRLAGRLGERRGRPNGWRYPLVGGMRERHFDGSNSKPRKLPENAATPTTCPGVLCLGCSMPGLPEFGARFVGPLLKDDHGLA